MKLGVVFPQTEIGSDPAVIRDYAQAAKGAGYDHLAFDQTIENRRMRIVNTSTLRLRSPRP